MARTHLDQFFGQGYWGGWRQSTLSGILDWRSKWRPRMIGVGSGLTFSRDCGSVGLLDGERKGNPRLLLRFSVLGSLSDPYKRRKFPQWPEGLMKKALPKPTGGMNKQVDTGNQLRAVRRTRCVQWRRGWWLNASHVWELFQGFLCLSRSERDEFRFDRNIHWPTGGIEGIAAHFSSKKCRLHSLSSTMVGHITQRRAVRAGGWMTSRMYLEGCNSTKEPGSRSQKLKKSQSVSKQSSEDKRGMSSPPDPGEWGGMKKKTISPSRWIRCVPYPLPSSFPNWV